ncbi:phosphopantetheine-binding protein [Streptomyces sp. NPDC026589]|uniref:phosphopantetheine-binding protein n=1 Tax=Streptomyces sp. NPDC026589 TaxID=3155609 RepID=UPI0033FA9F59
MSERVVPWDSGFESLLRAYLPFLAPSTAIEPATRLSLLGLDSLGTVNLMVDLEDAYRIEFPDGAIGRALEADASWLWTTVRELSTGRTK